MAKKILIIEDEAVIAGMYEKLLVNHGYEVAWVADGETGLRTALRDRPDLILLDLKMPKMDGMTVLNNIRKDEWGKDAKVIILTNFELNDGLLSGVVQNQPSYYLIKSNNKPPDILAYINEVIGPPA